MGLKKHISLFLIGLLLVAASKAQNHHEAAYLQLSSTSYLVGEKLHFSAFVFSSKTGQPSNLSSILYIDLLDWQGTSVARTKIGLKEGRGSGHLLLDTDLPSGTYRIYAYTRWMKNYDGFFDQQLWVHNPYDGIVEGTSIPGNASKKNQYSESLPSCKPVDSVEIDLGDIDPATLSITVSIASKLSYTNELSIPSYKPMEGFDYLPEYKFGVIQGKVANADQVERVNLSLNGSSLQIKTSRLDESGRFRMFYNPQWAKGFGYLFADGLQDFSASVVGEFYADYPVSLYDSVLIDSVIAEEIKTRSIASQIERAYTTQAEEEEASAIQFLPVKASVYVLDEYERFSTIRDTFIELVPEVGVSKDESNYRMTMRCERPPGLLGDNEEILYLLDGVIVSSKDLLELSPNDVERIEVLAEYYFVDDHYFKGVISLHSKDFDVDQLKPEGSRISLVDYQPYKQAAYRVNLADERDPNYRSLLLWQSEYVHTGGSLKVGVPTSRMTGVFELRVNGLSREGVPINVVRKFLVAENSL